MSSRTRRTSSARPASRYRHRPAGIRTRCPTSCPAGTGSRGAATTANRSITSPTREAARMRWSPLVALVAAVQVAIGGGVEAGHGVDQALIGELPGDAGVRDGRPAEQAPPVRTGLVVGK